MSKSYYIINVFGKKPVPVQVGTINKTSGQPNPGAVNATQEVGEINIPNFSRVWGKLEREKDKKLTGAIEFLPWGDPKGEIVRIRFVKNCSNSISVDYQEEKKILPNLTDEDNDTEIRLKIGENKFEETTNKMKILLLKYHTLNRSNGSRNPENRITRFENYKAGEETGGFVASDMENRQRAERVVLDARAKLASLEILAILFGLSPEDNESTLFTQLAAKAQNPNEFFKVLQEHAALYRKSLVKANEIQLIDLGFEDVVTITIGGIKDTFLTGVEGANVDERIDYITDNMTEPMYYHALERLPGELERFADLVLE